MHCPDRTEQSLVGKLLDMRKVYLRKSSYSRAARTFVMWFQSPPVSVSESISHSCLFQLCVRIDLPDVIFDADSVAHKIFEAGELFGRLLGMKYR